VADIVALQLKKDDRSDDEAKTPSDDDDPRDAGLDAHIADGMPHHDSASSPKPRARKTAGQQ
jgi:hypothetical protein